MKWEFKDLVTAETYSMHINPNAGGSPGVEKTVNSAQVLAPSRRAIVWEGAARPTQMEFSGVVLDQDHYETLEGWFMRRTLIQITDDLGRVFQGVLAAFKPERERKAFNPWYHKYSASVLLTAMKNASGDVVYGTIVTEV